MRIAFTHAFCWPEVRRGAERFIQECGAALVDRGHTVTVLSAAWDHRTTTLDGVRTVRLPRRLEDPIAHERDFSRRLLRHLVLGRYDAVHSMGHRDARVSVVAARVHPRRRTVITDLGSPIREWWETARKPDAHVVEKVVAGIDVYSCMSRYSLGYLARDYGRTNGVVIPGGVDMRKMVPAASRTPEPTLLFSAALDEPRKGLPTLLEALPLVASHEPGVRLWLSGPGDPAGFLAAAPEAARERTDVLGVGESDKQHERYGAAWVTCLPSISDSFGMALIESMSCGTPLMVSTDGAPQELVIEGSTGELCTFGDAQSVAAACLRAIDLARRPATVEACRDRAARFDWRTGIAPFVESVYRGDAVSDAPPGV